MLEERLECPGLPGSRQRDPELALSRWIAGAAVVESLAFERARKVPQARVSHILLLSQDMERLVQHLQAVLRAHRDENVSRCGRG